MFSNAFMYAHNTRANAMTTGMLDVLCVVDNALAVHVRELVATGASYCMYCYV